LEHFSNGGFVVFGWWDLQCDDNFGAFKSHGKSDVDEIKLWTAAMVANLILS